MGYKSQDEVMEPNTTDDILMLRRLRNVTAVQVRNLTPFPVRDSFATAMTQPSEQSQFTTHGRLSDDLDLTIGRRRGRKTSSSSVMTLRTSRSQEGEDAHDASTPGDMQPRRRTMSKVSFIDPSRSSPQAGRRLSQSYGSPSGVRPHRQRTTSTGSYRSLGTNSAVIAEDDVASMAHPQLSRLLPDNSQKSLEKVITSRLVETFITITVPSTFPESDVDGALSSLRHATSTPPDSRPVSPALSSDTKKDPASASRHKSSPSTSTAASQRLGLGLSSPSSLSTITVSPPASPLPRHTTPKSAHARTKSAVSSRLYDKAPPRSPSSTQFFPSTATLTSSSAVPDYISPIHAPSTNPLFSLDPGSGREFPAWTNLSAQEMRLELWGKVGSGWGNERSAMGKGKEKAVDGDSGSTHSTWQLLQKWDVKFSELRRFSGDLTSHPSHLSFNTLTITLGPHGHTYYVPSRSPSDSSSRPSSPAGDKSEQPDIATLRSAGDIIVPASASGLESAKSRTLDLRAQRNDSLLARLKRHPESAKTASWQDLVRLVTLQTCILDTEQSLSQVAHDVDLLVADGLSDLKREVSERQEWLHRLQAEKGEVDRASDDLRYRIRARHDDLRQRRETLRQAREELQLDMFAEHETEEELEDMREQLSSLRSNFPPVRTTLIATLASIFPIELLATTPDLLYAILDVPLPIPTGTTDPAPPLSVPSRKDVNEDTVATALGYAAQVVQLLAAYLGKRLVYPVTCVGSRSLVKDGISAMVGPRMFPLYSKGVDTYRFEYGVYLLNKDIEMLMTERDLRATDTRYTLPNLNNLLLTLSAGKGLQLPLHAPADSLPSSRAESPAPSEDLSVFTEDSLPTSTITSPVSGSTTPTAASAAEGSTFSRMSRFALSPFGLLRSSSSEQPPSKSSRSVSNGAELPAEAEGNGDARNPRLEQSVDDEEDRRTIRAVSLHGDETKGYMNGSSGNGTVPQAEKATDGSGPQVSTPTSNIVAPIV
ncbi:hypothetical protein OE88DRAFT_1651553 [Heliocybe sulcata]|uniref:Autophagy-related protein 14 n=1 Tax=Heliocybe sulcata TaxID=5364 RepID=A0A5C3NLE1_9AGAM|nr:hypothetical protein OE88DRAFT_1651553 [Heliocybe sulcata]